MEASSYLIYQKKDSLIEKWDPRIKIVCSILLTVSLLISHSIIIKSLMVLLLVVLWGMAKLSWKIFLITVFSLTIFFLSTMIYNVFLTKSMGPSIQVLSLVLPISGLQSGFLMCEQILGVILALSLLVRTTSPIQLSEAVEQILTPLKKLKMPIHELTLMFSISIRYLPLLMEEFENIKRSQMSRGGDLYERGLLSKVKGLFPIIMPLFISSIFRAKDLAIAMESRCYHGDENRTPIHIYQVRITDYCVLLVTIIILFLTLYSRLYLKE
ncbi:energy-coupling factor transporter transmembrane protein EcfT [Sporolactobacillus shoreae]|uniref:Energy-coupling factor transporter transmembrane protein EcfT n=1 Tax=Sporolactobacillus shoreae TaxID=1465501 RepID=A0A4Z0GHG3_9BACL|nr:energy-coupling factor transporter transmembrane component T [Sporolactobacillus shoreae]TGA96137.1 energy-coupling factor transporter transmembrane protein EcfT [Sporolactobacillus shoreae]